MSSTSSYPSELYRLCELPRPCSYLPEETASLEYRSYAGLSPAQLESLLARGWRRFGIDLFRPACRACAQCVPIRVNVREFQPSRSQRRAWTKNSHVQVIAQAASVSQEHVDLYNAWHEDMVERKDWRHQHHSLRGYAQSFLLGEYPSLHELQFRIEGKLVGISIIDVLPNALSSVYFFHAPDWRELSPGTFSVLCELDLARRLQREHLYLGYWIGACPSMAYKNRFGPNEVLLSRPWDNEGPAWLKGTPEVYNVPTSDRLS